MASAGTAEKDDGAIAAIRKQMGEKRWPQALRLIERLGAADITPDVMLWKARAHYHAGELPQAKAGFSAILAADGFNREALLTLARMAYRAQDWATVRAHMTRLLEASPEDADAHILLARTASNDKDDDLAVTHYEAVRALRPDDPEVLKSLGRLYSRTGANEAAMNTLGRLVGLNPSDVEANLLLGRAAYAARNDAAAQEALERLIAADPKHSEGRVLMGRVLSRRRDDEPALKLWTDLAGDKATAREANVQLARIHARLEGWKAAEKHAKAALKIDPAHGEMRRLLATAAARTGRSSEAQTLWSDLLKADPDDTQAAIEIARAMAAQGDLKGARERLRPIAANGKDLGVLIELTRLDLLAKEGNPRKAGTALQAAERDIARLVQAMLDGGLAPLSQFGPAFDELALAEAFGNESRWTLAQRLLESVPDSRKKADRLWARVMTGLRKPEADKAWLEILKREADDHEALSQRALIALREGRSDDAVKLAETWLKAAPKSVEARAFHARALTRAGRQDDALSAWQEARKRAPKSVEAWSGEATAAWAVGDHEAARQAAASALKLDPRDLNAAIIAARWAQANDKPDAADMWLRVVNLAPERLEAHLQVARLMRKTERTEEAIEAYRRVLAIDPAHKESLSQLGRMLRAEKRRDEECEIWESFIEHHPETAEPRLFLARCRAHDRDLAGAIDLYRSILKFEPTNTRAIDELSELVARAVG